MRAIAVLAVVAFHATPDSLPSGYLGVDIFFVISGYLISRILFGELQRGQLSIRGFYYRRVRRIFPALLVVLVACLAAGYRSLLAEELRELGKHVAAGSVFLSNVVLWREAGYFDKAAELKPLLHLWSLGVEEQFYIVWPVTLALLWKRPRLIMPAISLVIVLSFGLNLSSSISDVAKFYLPVTRFWELCAGGALAYRHHVQKGLGTVRPTSIVHQALGVSGAALIVVAILFAGKSTPYLAWWSLAATLGSTLVIAAPQETWINRTILGNPALVAIGLISYPLYLWHWPIIAFLRIQGRGDNPPPTHQAMLIGVMFLLAWLTYQFVEKPIRAHPRARLTMPILCSTMALVGSMGLYLVVQDGLPKRFTAEAQRLANFKYPQYRKDGRMPACWLSRKDRVDQFAPECVEKTERPGQPLVALWGDSHVALMYLGVKAMQEKLHFRVAQFTRSSCPPLSGRECAASNAWVMQRLAALHPDTVLMGANWNVHWKDEGAQTLRSLEKTIVALKNAGTRRVAVIGPVPKWKNGLPRSLFNFYRQDFPLGRIPNRMNFGLVPDIPRIDAALRRVVLEQGGTYISPRQLLCTEDGCLTYLDDKPSHLTAWDTGHLTEWGAKYLVARFPAAIWQ